MKKVTTIVRNLDQLSTYITDQSSLSSNIFNITEFPLEFTIGKNLIKLKGNTNIFEVGTELAIEILDSNRNPIYHEIIDYIEKIFYYPTSRFSKYSRGLLHHDKMM